MNIDSLISAKWIIPVTPGTRLLENHAIAVDQGKIIDIQPADSATAKYKALENHTLDKHVLIPGLINAHTHSAMTLFRGLADDLPLMEWLNDKIWPAEQKWVNREFVEDGTRLAIAEMLRGGTTCFNDMYYFPDSIITVSCDAGIRVSAGLILIDFPSPWANDANEYISKAGEIHNTYKHHPLVSTIYAPHSTYTVSDDPLKKTGILAEELDIQINIHLHEAKEDINHSLEQHGKRPLRRLQDLELLGPRLVAIHMTQVAEDEFDLLAHFGVHVVHCPESNLKLANGFCPVKKLLDAGVNVCLGTDGAASNNDLDMLGEMRTAALLGKAIADDCTALPAYSILEMATINAARALGLEDRIGSLTAGKEADIVAIDLESVDTQPVYDPVSHLVYAANKSQVSDVWVAGKQLLKNRALITLDEEQLIHRARYWREKLLS